MRVYMVIHWVMFIVIAGLLSVYIDSFANVFHCALRKEKCDWMPFFLVFSENFSRAMFGVRYFAGYKIGASQSESSFNMHEMFIFLFQTCAMMSSLLIILI